MTELDVIVVLGGATFEESQQRVDEMVRLRDDDIAPHTIVTGAFWGFGSSDRSENPMSRRMFDYAVEKRGLSQDTITIADQSLDTIGDALAVKHIMHERGERKLALVTTESHLPRAESIFRHVLGSDYLVKPFSSGEYPGRHGQAIYEHMGKLLSSAVLNGTEPGDDQAIMSRLFALVPGYTEASKREIAANHIKLLLRMPWMQPKP